MNIVKKIILLIIPITILLSLIAYGLQSIFNIENITYLKTITTEHGTTFQYYDWNLYVNNLKIADTIKNLFTKTLDVQAIKNSVGSFYKIWNDGYNIGDLGKTLITGFNLIGNVIILMLNVIILPIRIVVILILTILSILGINISAESEILDILKWIINDMIIPSIPISNL